jgi:hypothetical protein
MNQLDGKPIFLEKSLFLSDVGLTELSRDEAGDTDSRKFRALRRIATQKYQQKSKNRIAMLFMSN